MKTFSKNQLAELCKKVSELTDQNDHTEARIAISKFFGLKHFTKIFEAIQVINNAEGSMPISEYRQTVGYRLLQAIKQEYGSDVSVQIYRAL